MDKAEIFHRGGLWCGLVVEVCGGIYYILFANLVVSANWQTCSLEDAIVASVLLKRGGNAVSSAYVSTGVQGEGGRASQGG